MPEDTENIISDAVAAVEISDGDDAAAAKKKEANRKKREKAKAKKLIEKAAADAEDANPEGRWQRGKLPGNRADRRGAGSDRGLGVFALEPIKTGEFVAAAPPALSVVFDNHVQDVCGFCFDKPKDANAVEELSVTLTTAPADGDASKPTFGIKLDDHVPQKGGDLCTMVTMVTKESPNRDVVQLGDRLLAVEGTEIGGGHEKAVPLLLAAAQKNGGSVSVTIGRPALLSCPGCNKLSACAKCNASGLMKWHAYECKLFNAMPPQAIKGADTSTLRLLLRYKVCSTPLMGEWGRFKEPISLLSSLQANACDVPPDQLAGLSKLTGVASTSVAALIFQIRTNACQITRGLPAQKVGCAVSVLTGWHNHDCVPNAEALVREDGLVAVRALKDIDVDEEVLISYIDATKPHDERCKILSQHYGFDCTCARCVTESRKALSKRMKDRDQYLAGQRR